MHKQRKMLIYAAWFVLICFFVVGAKYFYIQIVQSEYLQEKVVDQRVRQMPITPKRGTIEDRNGKALALSLVTKDVNVFPKFIDSEKKQEKMAKVFVEYLDVDYKEVMKKLKSESEWDNIAKRVDIKVVEELEVALKKEGLGSYKFVNSSKRYYPNGTLASNILGFVNAENVAGAGIEISMDSYLAGVPGYVIAETYPDGRSIPIGFENNSSQVDGQDLTLSIDSYIQYVLENRLQQGMEEMDADAIHAIVMNPNTGEILAMASTPSFDPRDYEASNHSTWTNNPAAFVYEPGSTFKPVFMAMALEAGHISTDFTYFDGGTINIQGTSIKNWDSRGLGQAGLRDIIINSSNVGMINISKQVSSKEIVSGLKRVGFGQKTGITIPAEESGLFPTAEQLDNDPLMKATVSFGQGIAITPVQLITAFSEIINGGYDISPTLSLKAEDETGNVMYQANLDKKERVYKEEVSKAMKSYLRANSEEGSGRDYQLDGYNSGAKTGSAWVVENGVYKRGAIIGSFIGFAPYDDPELAMLVVVDEPKTSEFGGPAAGPIYHDVMTEALRYLNEPKEVETETKEEEEEIKIPVVETLLYEDAEATLKKELKGVTVKKKGDGEYVAQQEYSYKNGKMTVTLRTKKINDNGYVHIPYLIGKTEKEVKVLLKGSGVEVIFHGDGSVKEQNVEPGQYKSFDKLIIWLD